MNLYFNQLHLFICLLILLACSCLQCSALLESVVDFDRYIALQGHIENLSEHTNNFDGEVIVCLSVFDQGHKRRSLIWTDTVEVDATGTWWRFVTTITFTLSKCPLHILIPRLYPLGSFFTSFESPKLPLLLHVKATPTGSNNHNRAPPSIQTDPTPQKTTHSLTETPQMPQPHDISPLSTPDSLLNTPPPASLHSPPHSTSTLIAPHSTSTPSLCTTSQFHWINGPVVTLSITLLHRLATAAATAARGVVAPLRSEIHRRTRDSPL